ncbi:MAG: hypothetical protein NVS2B16_36720 [Chloroflexota bacterium]
MTESASESGAYQVPIDLQMELDTWRRAHPRATFVEMEEGVAAILNRARVVMLEQLADRTAGIPTRCPTCGRSMVSRGERTRELQAEGGEVVRLRRPYYTCPDCHTALFPPG